MASNLVYLDFKALIEFSRGDAEARRDLPGAID
jgi:hypothetical protein